MKILLITQDDPFYLAKNIDYLINNLPSNSEIVGCVVTSVSPFGKKESFARKAFKTFKIFWITMHGYTMTYFGINFKRKK